ncbi:Bifunctional purine biosynthesis protein PurH [Coemansia spiralis]|uniref:Bifunctional purine biosynthesis protein PurH n=2 Tax=Coemansia TaxID=4863 RepID=A0A9W8KXZ5_9FUNG|nr:Bifunctional purine biosynthesis protein PurH [Coemansia umbellata]KAJ2622036.1 Bifunctional purine biosynthesis protein PurH [Coemansia sp. RSA 1358]KAJ2677640.1 Bifunctional purine biosynthesis protein PurH [Coemansia spiralis]
MSQTFGGPPHHKSNGTARSRHPVGTSLPRIFAVDMHEVDSNKFRDSREAGFSWYILFTTLIVSLSAATVGWAIGIANSSKPIIFLMHTKAGLPHMLGDSEFPYRIPFSESMWSVATGVLSVGGVLGAACSGTIANCIGRRNALTINNGFFFAGAVLMGTATTSIHFIFGRFVLGIGCGIASCVANMYIGEIAPIWWRGFFGSFFQFALLLGILCAQLAAMFIADGMQWRIIVAVPGALALVQVILLPFRVESPSYLVKSHHITEARHALLTLRRGFDVAAEWQDILAMLDTSDIEHCTSSCLTDSHAYSHASHSAAAAATTAITAKSHANKNKDNARLSATSSAGCSANTNGAITIPVNSNSALGKCDSDATMKDSSKQATKQTPASTTGADSTLTFADSVPQRIQPAFAKHTASIMQMIRGRTREDLRHLVVCSAVLMALQQLSGITSVLFCAKSVATVIFEPSDVLSIAGACIFVCIPAIPAVVFSKVCADRWGRRPLLLCSLGLMSICNILTSAGLFYGPDCMVMVAVFVCYFAFNIGIGPVPWYYMTECVPSYALSAAMAIGCSLNWALAIAVDLLIPIIENVLPQWLFVFFGGFTLLGFLFVLLFVPETMGRPIAHTVMLHEGMPHFVFRSREASRSTGDFVELQTK